MIFYVIFHFLVDDLFPRMADQLKRLNAINFNIRFGSVWLTAIISEKFRQVSARAEPIGHINYSFVCGFGSGALVIKRMAHPAIVIACQPLVFFCVSV